MKKMNAIMEQYAQTQEEKKALTSDIAALKEKQERLNARAEENADAGNVDAYMDIKAQADRCGAEAYVKQKRLNKLGPLPEQEVRAAWAEYIAPVNTELENRLAAYRQACEELFEKYKQVFILQEQAYQMRELCAIYTGHSMTDLDVDAVLGSYSMNMLEFADIAADNQFFSRVCKDGAEQTGRIARLTFSHRTQ